MVAGAGWIAVVIDDDGAIDCARHDDIESLHRALGAQADLVLVDIPIGLPERVSSRACDDRARALLRPGRSASVFNPPVRAILAATSYDEACRLSLAACGKKISRQTHNIVPKIREVDAFLRARPRERAHYRECHPELAFRGLFGGSPAQHRKNSAEGIAERLDALAVELPDLPALYDRVMTDTLRRDLARDDFLDAAVLAWAAHRFGDELVALPEGQACRDGMGLRMEILSPPVALDEG